MRDSDRNKEKERQRVLPSNIFSCQPSVKRASTGMEYYPFALKGVAKLSEIIHPLPARPNLPSTKSVQGLSHWLLSRCHLDPVPRILGKTVRSFRHRGVKYHRRPAKIYASEMAIFLATPPHASTLIRFRFKGRRGYLAPPATNNAPDQTLCH